MNEIIAERLTLFVENSCFARRCFSWTAWPQARRLTALTYAFEDRHLDADAITESADFMKKNAGTLSMFRSTAGASSLCVAANLSLYEDREQLFKDILMSYGSLRSVKFRASNHLAIAASLVATGTERHNFEEVATRAKIFFEGLRGRSWFLTRDDSIFSVMMGLSDMAPSVGIERVEGLQQQLKIEFGRCSRRAVQALAQIIVLSGEADDTLSRLIGLNKALRAQNIRLDKNFTLPSLGILSLLPVDNDTLASDIVEAQNYLKGQKGFRLFSTQERLLFASAIVSSAYAEDYKQSIDNLIMGSTVVSALDILAVQYIALLAVAMSVWMTAFIAIGT